MSDPVDLVRKGFRAGTGLRVRSLEAITKDIAAIGTAIRTCLEEGRMVLAFGNGGSAAQAQHLAAELVGRFRTERRALPAIALSADTAVLTALANDFGFERVFARQIEAFGRPGDVAVALSTGGRSPNVLAAVRAAQERGLRTFALTSAGSELSSLVERAVAVPSTSPALIQELHLSAVHLICAVVDGVEAADEGADRSGGSAKIVDWPTLLELRQKWRSDGRAVAWTNGCFDLLHAGHARTLEAARGFGDVLVVGVNDDASVRTLKGAGRPIIPLGRRMELLAALEAVDHVIELDAPTPEAALARLRPDVHCKGADYAPPHGKRMPELELVRGYGGRVEFVPLLPELSTSEIVHRIGKASGGHDASGE